MCVCNVICRCLLSPATIPQSPLCLALRLCASLFLPPPPSFLSVPPFLPFSSSLPSSLPFPPSISPLSPYSPPPPFISERCKISPYSPMLSRAPAACSLTPAACWSKASTGPAVAALGAQADSKPSPPAAHGRSILHSSCSLQVCEVRGPWRAGGWQAAGARRQDGHLDNKYVINI